jgi:hypothetical protein
MAVQWLKESYVGLLNLAGTLVRTISDIHQKLSMYFQVPLVGTLSKAQIRTPSKPAKLSPGNLGRFKLRYVATPCGAI